MNKEMFLEQLQKLNIILSEKQMDQLDKYYEILIDYNKKINLTNITLKDQVYLKHFYDSLTLMKVIDLNKDYSLCDIGTGAGFPGIVLKIVFPNLKVTLIDALEKRVKFLNYVKTKLDLDNLEIFHIRAEEYAKQNRNHFDITTSRAVAHLSILLEFAIPMTKENGYFIALKGKVEKEINEIDHAQKELNVILLKKESFNLPIENSNRTILKFQKKKDNIKYPRKYNEIKKNKL